MPSVGFETAIPTFKRLQTYALRCTATWIGRCLNTYVVLPSIVIDLFLNNQSDALIIPILLCYKSLHVSAIFSAHHQEFSAVHLALVSFMQVFDDRFHAESGWKRSSETRMKLTSAECTVENS
jgi:hypothetical protein